MKTLLGAALSVVILAGPLLAQGPPGGRRGPAAEGAPRALALPEKNPYESPSDVELGKQYFQARCGLCHGKEGEGGRGVNLTTGQYRWGGSDRELFLTIRNGIPGSDMPPSRFSEAETWRIVAAVKRLGRAGAQEKASGDAAAGKVVYDTKGGCVACHLVNGQGGSLGPELTRIGLQRSLKYLRESLVNPAADLPAAYRGVTVVTASGEQVTGVRLNEDDYSIQIRDLRDNPRSILKTNVKEIRRDRPSLMPSYGSILTPSEIENLVAYLSSLRGPLAEGC